jgi:hypothetical protein
MNRNQINKLTSKHAYFHPNCFKHLGKISQITEGCFLIALIVSGYQDKNGDARRNFCQIHSTFPMQIAQFLRIVIDAA